MLFHKCGLTGAPLSATDIGGAGRGAAVPRPFTVDLHCHVLVPQIEKLVADRPEKLAEPQLQLETMGVESVEHNRKHMLPAAVPKMLDLQVRLADMDGMGVDLQVISPSPPQYYYWADPDLARTLVRMQNEYIARTCESNPKRLAGLGNIALQHPQLAVEQLDHAVKQLGLKGIEVSTTVNGLELSDPTLEPVWAKAAELGCVVFIHPFGTSLGKRVNRFYLQNMIGQPLETTVALSSLIFSGTLDRHPGLKLLAAHGGGYLPYYIGRSNHGHHVRPEAQRAMHAPAEYLRRIWFDSLVFEPHILRHLIDVAGVERVVVGTDYPFDMGHYEIHALLDRVEGLTPRQRERILGGNALELLGMKVTQPSA
jgi:aminocarboxymuconate-semialdehyde decarboxylase